MLFQLSGGRSSPATRLCVNSLIGATERNSASTDVICPSQQACPASCGEAGEGELDRYERQRRHVAVAHTQAQTIRNRRLLEERDPAVRRKNLDELKRTADDPALARAYLLRTALIASA